MMLKIKSKKKNVFIRKNHKNEMIIFVRGHYIWTANKRREKITNVHS